MVASGRPDQLLGQIVPAVGREHRAAQFVMQFAQQGYQALGMDGLFLGAQRLAGAQLLQHVVDAGPGQLGELRLLMFAVGIT